MLENYHCSVENTKTVQSIPLIGFLPIEVSNAVPDIQASQNEAPPPLPPRISDDDIDKDTPQPSPPDNDSMQEPPPVPVKKARHLT